MIRGEHGKTETEAMSRWMRRCDALAHEAAAAGEAAVGCVVTTDDDARVADGGENVRAARDVSAHADIEAIRAACHVRGTLDLSGRVLCTTTEPSILCSYAIRETTIARVVIGAWVDDIGGVTSAFPVLLGPDVPGWRPPPEIVHVPARRAAPLFQRSAFRHGRPAGPTP
jgi:tRNA(Arg) A34 adenosine deaminase TadA